MRPLSIYSQTDLKSLPKNIFPPVISKWFKCKKTQIIIWFGSLYFSEYGNVTSSDFSPWRHGKISRAISPSYNTIPDPVLLSSTNKISTDASTPVDCVMLFIKPLSKAASGDADGRYGAKGQSTVACNSHCITQTRDFLSLPTPARFWSRSPSNCTTEYFTCQKQARSHGGGKIRFVNWSADRFVTDAG